MTNTTMQIHTLHQSIRKTDSLTVAEPCSGLSDTKSPLQWWIIAPAFSKAIETVERHQDRILERWTLTHNNARLEALNGIFKAARARARGYRNVATFMTMIYLIAAPLGKPLKST